MLKPEARWIGERLASIARSRVTPLLNVGSSTRHFREVQQPWIDGEIFAPLRSRGDVVIHQDLKADEGVDIVGDLAERSTVERLGDLGIRSILCSNVLEHVPDPAAFASRLLTLVPTGGVLVVTVPRAFPWHPDPIDTLFRPSVAELTALFPSTRVLAADLISCGRLPSLVLDSARSMSKRRRRAKGAAEPQSKAPRAPLRDWLWPWLVRPFEVTCVMLERN